MLSKIKLLIVFTLIVTVIFILFISPFLTNLFGTTDEPFSELWLLDAKGTTENYPHNITSNQNYGIYLGVCNRLNEETEYSLRVKLCNSADQLPNMITAEPSSSSALEEYDFILLDEKDWGINLSFALDYVLIQHNITRIETIRINGVTISVNDDSIWDSNRNGFYSVLVFELWTYNKTLNSFTYGNQNVCLQLNMTSTSNVNF